MTIDRFLGCLVGLAVGDAIGTTVEFRARGTFPRVTDMVGGGPFGLQPGEWTDDTSMALCLGRSLVERGGFDPADQMNRYCNWANYGYLSSTGECFDIGNTVADALRRYELSKDPFSGSTNPRTAGNGAIMRLAPIPMFFIASKDQVIHYSGESSRTTHGAPEAVDCARLFGAQLQAALSGRDKAAIIEDSGYAPVESKVRALAAGDYRVKPTSAIKGSGYVVESLEAALWCFCNTSTYAAAVLAAANLGDDADTTSAICGQIAGAHYGYSEIPGAWRERLSHRELIENLARELFEKRALEQLGVS
jgi:ADP-ribosyl-[dinitrogen reductase] hydrolase